MGRRPGRHLPRTTDAVALGAAIERERTALGWSRSRLAAELGVSRQAVWCWEWGDALPTVPVFASLRILLGIDEAETFRTNSVDSPTHSG